ncbi:MAG: hypothetical protein IJQ23_03220, partial [Clostridia bacterium]|nr:hypothetical protein [Clostridia bacterium]
MANYKKYAAKDGTPIQVQSAIEDGSGKNIENDYAKQNGAYENLYAGNLITDQNWSWVNDFVFGTGTVDTVFNGEATIKAIRGRTEWDGTTPHYVNVVSNKSVLFNLYNPSTHYAHVVESDNENNGLCVYGTGIDDTTVMEFSETSDFATITEIALTEETNSTGETYLHCAVSSDGYLRVKGTEPDFVCIANVWGGNRVSYHPEYAEDIVSIDTSSYFASGMKSIHINGEETVYDEMYSNKYYARVVTAAFGASPSITYVAASGSYNIYRKTLSNALNKGACEIGGSTKFTWTNIGQMSSSSPITADCMSLYTGYIYFAIAQSEDTSYTYTQDELIVDQTTFDSELADKGHLFTENGGVYTETTTYDANETYYYISATDVH